MKKFKNYGNKINVQLFADGDESDGEQTSNIIPSIEPIKKPEKTFTQTELDKIITQRLAREKMTSDEKLASDKLEFEKQIEQTKIEMNQEVAKNLVSKYKLKENNVNTILKLVTSDKQSSISDINSFCEIVDTLLESQKKEILAGLNSNSKAIDYNSNKNNDTSIAKRLFDNIEPQKKDIKNNYK